MSNNPLLRQLSLAGVLALTLAGQAQAQSDLKPADSPAATLSNAAPVTVTSVAPDYVPDDKHKLRIGDRLSFQIIEDRDPARGLVVADSAEVDVPYIGRIKAVDKTCKQLAEEIKVLLERDYYHRATVVLAVDVATRVVGKVYLWGAVRAQGPMDLLVNEELTAGKALLRVGFGEFANKKKVKLVRSTGPGSTNKDTRVLDMVEILEQGKSEKDVVLQPEDFIIVPTSPINL